MSGAAPIPSPVGGTDSDNLALDLPIGLHTGHDRFDRRDPARHRPLAGSWLDDPLADGEAHQLGQRAQPELAHDRCAMGLDGFDAEVQMLSDHLC